MAADLGDLIARVLLDSKEFTTAMQGVETQAKDTADKASGSMSGMGSAMDLLTGGAIALAGAFAVDKLLDFGGAALEAAQKTEHLEAAFRAINGPTKETNELLATLTGMEFHSLYDFEDTLGPAAKNMLDLGISSDQTSKTMTALVDAASGMKKGPEWITAVSGTLATMQTHIVASGKDFKALEAQGVDAWGALATKIGTSIPEAMEKVKAGTISAETVTAAVTEQMGTQWKGAGDASVQGWEGAMQILDQATEEVMVSLGKTIGDVIVALKPIIDIAVQGILAFAQAWDDTQGPLSWIQDHWPAIKAVWAEVTLILSEVFAPIKPIWEAVWGGIQTVITGVLDSIGQSIKTFTDGIATVIGWIGSVASKLPGVSNAIQQIGFVWDEETKKITASKAALEAKKEAEEAAIASSKKTAQASKAAAEGELLRANQAKEAAKAAKEAATENDKLAKSWEANDKAFRASQKKNDDDFSKAYASMKKVAVDTVEVTVNMWDRLPPAVRDAIKPIHEAEFSLKALGITSEQELKQAAADAQNWANKVEEAFLAGKTSAGNYSAALEAAEAKQKALVDYTNRDLIGAYKALGVTSQATLQQTATDAEAAYGRIKASGTATTGDLYLAWQAVKTAQQAVVDHADKELTDAYHNLGVKSAAEMHTLATEAESAYQKIARDAGDNSIAAKTAWINKTQEAYADILAQGGHLTTEQSNELDRAKTMLDNHLTPVKSAWQTTYDGVKGAVTGAVDSMIEKFVTGKGSFQEILTTMWQDIASACLHSFIDPITKEISTFIATTIADLIGGKGFGGVIDSIKKIGTTASDVFSGAGKAAGGAIPSVPGGAPSVPSIPGAGGGGDGGLMGILSGGLLGNIFGGISAVSGIAGNFQNAKMETTMNAVEHNTRYSMMYLGERADGGILGISFRIFEEIAYGTLPKAMEKHRDQFFDWTGFVNPIFEVIRNSVMDSYPVLVDIRTMLGDIRAMVSDVAGTARGNADLLREINVSIVAQGITTAEAARALGDQIASNLKGQMVAA